MGSPPAVYSRALARFEGLMAVRGMTQVRAEYHEAAFGSAFAEYRDERRALRLIWDGKERALLAEVLRGGQWTDVEAPQGTAPPPLNHDQSDRRIALLLVAAEAALADREPDPSAP